MIVPISEIALGDYKEQLPQCLALARESQLRWDMEFVNLVTN